jgi:starch synthase
MLAMRAGQPCLAHSVGGLADTIAHDINGFTFNGDNPQIQAENMINCVNYAIELYEKNQQKWQAIGESAAQARFLWKDVALDYIKYLYAD